MKGVNKAIKDEAKEQKESFLGMLLDSLGATLLGNMLTGKRVTRTGERTIRAGKGTIREREDF